MNKLKEGDIVKLYKDDELKQFSGWCKLISHEPTDEVLVTINSENTICTRPYVVADDTLEHETFEHRDEAWFGKDKCVLLRIPNKRGKLLALNEEGDAAEISYPYKNIIKLYSPGEYELTYKGCYMGKVELIEDCRDEFKIKVVDSIRTFKRKHSILTRRKRSKRTTLYAKQRWKVSMFENNPMIGELITSEDIMYKDKGMVEDMRVIGNKLVFSVNGENFSENSEDLKHFYVERGFVTHRFIPFYLATTSRFTSYSESNMPYNKANLEDNSIIF